MSMQNSIYGGIPGPSWYVFDKVHVGSAKDLLNQASSDGIFIGRYVLVKYCEGLLEVEERSLLESYNSEIEITDDPTGDKKSYFLNYQADGAIQSYDRVVFQKIYKNNQITYHAICNLHQIQNIIIQPGEGGSETNPIRIVMLEPKASTDTDNDILTAVIDPNHGDIAIIRRLIVVDKYSYTAYVYNTNNWQAMDGNYDANNVYLSDNITLAGEYTQVGNLTKTKTGTAVFETAGKSIAAALTEIFSKRLGPSITAQPKVTLTFSQAKSYEVGTEVTPSYSAVLSAGSYTYGPNTGITATSWSVTDSKDNTSIKASDSFPAFTVADDENYTITAVAQHGAGAIAKDNLGAVTDGTYFDKVQIAAGSKTATSNAVTGYRSWFIGGDNKTSLDSDTIRALTNKATTYGTLEIKASDYPGCSRIIVAIPEAAKKSIQTVYLKSASNADILSEFKLQENTIEVKGNNNYATTKSDKIWIYQPASLDPSEIYTITIG